MACPVIVRLDGTATIRHPCIPDTIASDTGGGVTVPHPDRCSLTNGTLTRRGESGSDLTLLWEERACAEYRGRLQVRGGGVSGGMLRPDIASAVTDETASEWTDEGLCCPLPEISEVPSH